MAEATSGESKNGERAGAGGQSSGHDEDPASGQRVEERFEQWGRRLGKLMAGAAARAREEAEDIVAEAQSIRRGERD